MSKPLNLLMISFHFPPISASSGYLRALKFAKYLPQAAIEPTILTINEQAYDCSDKNNLPLLEQLPQQVEIYRAKGWDSRRTFAIKGKYLSWLALPDPWVSWIPAAIWRACQLTKIKNISAIWTTYPISSALFIGYFAARLTGKPLFVDLRDPVWEEETWQNSLQQRLIRWIEKQVINHAQAVVFTSPGTVKKYQQRYSAHLHEKFHLIENGFDEDDFQDLTPWPEEKPMVFLHSGLLPVYERDPRYFFSAVEQLKAQQALIPGEVLFRFRACGNEAQYQQDVKQRGIDDLIEFTGRLDYRSALAEMFSADRLMIFQHRTCDWQIPAKLFEYFRIGKPLLILAGQESDTIAIARQADCTFANAEIDHIEQIKQAIISLLKPVETAPVSNLANYSRQHGAVKLASLITSNLQL